MRAEYLQKVRALCDAKGWLLIMDEVQAGMVPGKTLGRVKAINYILNQLENRTVDTDFPMYSVYSYGIENVEKLEKKLEKEGYHIDKQCQIGATIGAHVGPGAFGVIFVEK